MPASNHLNGLRTRVQPIHGQQVFSFSNSYSELPERFYARLDPTSVCEPGLIMVNRNLAVELGIDPGWLESPAGIEILAGNRVPEGAEPLAMAYAGHQFGGWVPQLGDGRALLLGEVIDCNGHRKDIQLKGSGPTPFSRRGDGRAWLGPVLREYLVSEAMHALGIPTTRALAAATTGEPVYREGALPGAVLTRVARSHVRVGTFQYFYARNDTEALQLLAKHTIDRIYPELAKTENPFLSLLEEVVDRQARLIAAWMGVGFIHGVMNTDNTSLACETIDFGPCAFMDSFHPGKVFSSIDHGGRYAYSNQPAICLWNLAQLATTLVPILGPDKDQSVKVATEAINRFQDAFNTAWTGLFCKKLGLPAGDGDMGLITGFLDLMAETQADFTVSFRTLSSIGDDPSDDETLDKLIGGSGKSYKWIADWRRRLRSEGVATSTRQQEMKALNPAIIPRNHLVEQCIAAAVGGDFEPFERLNCEWSRPFDDRPVSSRLAMPPGPEEVVTRTFCGT